MKRIIEGVFNTNEYEAIKEFRKDAVNKGYEIMYEYEFTTDDGIDKVKYLYENKNIYGVSLMNPNLKFNLRNCKSDEDVAALGMIYAGRVNQYKGYELYNERYWLCYKINEHDNTIMTAVFYDEGNCYCDLEFTDMYPEQLLDELNKKD